ncbi:4390_t:CDS:1, partial [Gigaspora rosea]
LILVHSHDEEQFILCKDALHMALAAILLQLDNEMKEDLVEYASPST